MSDWLPLATGGPPAAVITTPEECEAAMAERPREGADAKALIKGIKRFVESNSTLSLSVERMCDFFDAAYETNAKAVLSRLPRILLKFRRDRGDDTAYLPSNWELPRKVLCDAAEYNKATYALKIELLRGLVELPSGVNGGIMNELSVIMTKNNRKAKYFTLLEGTRSLADPRRLNIVPEINITRAMMRLAKHTKTPRHVEMASLAAAGTISIAKRDEYAMRDVRDMLLFATETCGMRLSGILFANGVYSDNLIHAVFDVKSRHTLPDTSIVRLLLKLERYQIKDCLGWGVYEYLLLDAGTDPTTPEYREGVREIYERVAPPAMKHHIDDLVLAGEQCEALHELNRSDREPTKWVKLSAGGAEGIKANDEVFDVGRGRLVKAKLKGHKGGDKKRVRTTVLRVKFDSDIFRNLTPMYAHFENFSERAETLGVEKLNGGITDLDAYTLLALARHAQHPSSGNMDDMEGDEIVNAHRFAQKYRFVSFQLACEAELMLRYMKAAKMERGYVVFPRKGREGGEVLYLQGELPIVAWCAFCCGCRIDSRADVELDEGDEYLNEVFGVAIRVHKLDDDVRDLLGWTDRAAGRAA